MQSCLKQATCNAFCVFCALQVCDVDKFHPPYQKSPSSQFVYNLTGINVENYLMTTANTFIRNRWKPEVFSIHTSSII